MPKKGYNASVQSVKQSKNDGTRPGADGPLPHHRILKSPLNQNHRAHNIYAKLKASSSGITIPHYSKYSPHAQIEENRQKQKKVVQFVND